jgi:hypothetical protein
MPTIQKTITNSADKSCPLVIVHYPGEWKGVIASQGEVIVTGESEGEDGRFEVTGGDGGFVVTAHGIAGAATAHLSDGTDWEHTELKRELTDEEQMALYEESLKDDDWGHQPC